MAKFQVKYYIFFIASFVFFSILSLSLPLNILLNFAHDDSFFYLKIAKNFSGGMGFTFDGLSRTNGFHPLYLIIVSVLFSLLKFLSITSPEYMYRLVCILHLAIIHLTVLIAYHFFRPEEKGLYKFFAFLFLNTLFVFLTDFGLESHVSCLLFMIYVYNAYKKAHAIQTVLIKAAMISLLFLSRTDYLWSLIPFLIFSDFLSSSENHKKESFLYNIFFLSVTVFAYYSVNLFAFGNIQPVSSVVLNSFPQIMLFDNLKILFLDKGYLFNQTFKLLLVIAVTVTASLFLERKKDGVMKVLIFSSAGLILGLVINVFLNRYNVREWYTTFPVFISMFIISTILSFRRGKQYYFLYGLVSVLIVAFVLSTKAGAAKWSNSYEYAKMIAAKTTRSDYIYQYDYAGVVSFFSDRKIVNGDGLVNDFEYYSYMKTGRIPDYIRLKKINYVSAIIMDSVRYDINGYFDFQNEPFLNGLNVKKESVMLVDRFNFRSLIRNINGYRILIELSRK